MKNLEGSNNGVVIVDLELTEKYRIVDLHRCFNPTNGLNQVQFFINQLCILEHSALNLNGRRLIVVGDFNLDDQFKYNVEYGRQGLFNKLNETMDRIG